MQGESRVKKSLLNARVNMICYFVSLLTAFFTRRIFIDYLGLEFMGLTGTVGSVLSFLNLAELGVGTAIAFLLFKPVYQGDREKINELISVMGYLYRCIGLFIIAAGVVVSLFIPLIFKDTPFSFPLIYTAYYCFLASSMLGYFFNYRMTLLGADQRNYVITGYFQATTTSRLILQMVMAMLWANLYLYLAIELFFGVINTLLINWKLHKVYPWLRADVRLGRKLFKKYPEVTVKVKQVFVHKLGLFVYNQTTPFLIYAFASLSSVALYGNYTMLTLRIQNFFNGILDSVGSSVGNLVAEGDRDKIYRVFSQLFVMRLFVIGNLACCFFYLLSPFVEIWLGPECVMSPLVVNIIVVMYLLNVMRGPVDYYINGYGLFSDVWSPVVESVISISMAILLGSLWGLPGVLMGNLSSTVIIIYGWKPYYLFSRGMKRSVWQYWVLWFKNIIPVCVGFALAYFVTEYVMPGLEIGSRWTEFFVRSAIFTPVIAGVSFMLMWLSSAPMREFVKRFVEMRRNSHGR